MKAKFWNNKIIIKWRSICFSIDCTLALYHTPWSDFRRLKKIKIRLSQITFPVKYDNKNCTIIQQLSLAPQQLITSTYT